MDHNNVVVVAADSMQVAAAVHILVVVADSRNPDRQGRYQC